MAKMKVRQIKKKIKVKELGVDGESEEDIEDEEMDDSLTEEEIKMILAHKARLRAMKSGRGGHEAEIGLKQDMSALERVAQQAPVSETANERPAEQKREMKYADAGKGGSNYDAKKGYMDTGRYEAVDSGLAEDKMAKERRENMKRGQNPFAERDDHYNSGSHSGDEQGEDRKKKRQVW